jgi:hypothetical protein
MAKRINAEVDDDGAINLPEMDIQRMTIYIEGETELICNRFSPEAQEEILNKHKSEPTAGREKLDPEAKYKASLYAHPDGGYGFPGSGFKKAAVAACTSLKGKLKKTAVRQAFHVIEDLVRIQGEPYMRQDNTKPPRGGAQVRFRGAFKNWATQVTIRFNARALSKEEIINIFNVAGFAVGVGDWRPERDGKHGMFRVTKVGGA